MNRLTFASLVFLASLSFAGCASDYCSTAESLDCPMASTCRANQDRIRSNSAEVGCDDEYDTFLGCFDGLSITATTSGGTTTCTSDFASCQTEADAHSACCTAAGRDTNCGAM